MKRVELERRWEEAIIGQRASGLSIKEYCEQRTLCRQSFYEWRKRLGLRKEDENLGSGVNASESFMRIKPPEALLSDQPDKIATIQIETPNGYKVNTVVVDENGLRNVLHVLGTL
jgi:hypothetical protein